MVMNLSKLIKSLISIVLCLFLFSGCTQNRHLKDLLIVEGVGIDLTESKDIAVTLQSLKIGIFIYRLLKEKMKKAVSKLRELHFFAAINYHISQMNSKPKAL